MFLRHSQPPSLSFLSPFLLSLFHSILANTASRRSKSSRNTRHSSRERSSSHEAAAACILARAVLLEPDSTAICSPRQLICVLLFISFVCRCLLVGLITCTYEYGYLTLFWFYFIHFFFFFQTFSNSISAGWTQDRIVYRWAGRNKRSSSYIQHFSFLLFHTACLFFCIVFLCPPPSASHWYNNFFFPVFHHCSFLSLDLITYIHTYLLTYCHHCTEYSYTHYAHAPGASCIAR